MTHAGNVLFVIAAAVGGGSVNMAMLIIARFVMGIASSVPCTVGGGIIADLMVVEKRGRAMTFWTIGLLLVCSLCFRVCYCSGANECLGIGNGPYFRRLYGYDDWMAMDYLARGCPRKFHLLYLLIYETNNPRALS